MWIFFNSSAVPGCLGLSPGVMAARRALKAVLVDLNGTLHIEDSAVPGAQEALKRQVSPLFWVCSGRLCQCCLHKGVGEWGEHAAESFVLCWCQERSAKDGERYWCHLSSCCFPQWLFLCFLSLF